MSWEQGKGDIPRYPVSQDVAQIGPATPLQFGVLLPSEGAGEIGTSPH